MVDLPAPFSPTSPCTSPSTSEKSTSRSAWMPPNAFDTPIISRIGRSPGWAADAEGPAGPSACCSDWTAKVLPGSDQEVLLQPEMAGCGVLGDDRAVGPDVVGNAALAGFLAAGCRRNAGRDRPAVNAAGRVAHGGDHGAVEHGVDRRRHGVDAADDDVGASLGLHDVVRGQRHV